LGLVTIVCGLGDSIKRVSWLALDWQTGRPRYERTDLTTGAAVYADGRLYCLCEDGRAALLRSTPARFELDGQFRLLPEKVADAWAHPVLFGGRLYLRYHSLWCYDVSPAHPASARLSPPP